MVFVHLATLEEGEALFARLWPEAPAVSDPEAALYTAFERFRGSLRELLGPQVFVRGVQALLKGHLPGLPQGNPRIMPGMFLIDDGEIRWAHRSRHAGDHPDWSTVPRGETTA